MGDSVLFVVFKSLEKLRFAPWRCPSCCGPVSSNVYVLLHYWEQLLYYGHELLYYSEESTYSGEPPVYYREELLYYGQQILYYG